jgi:adenylate cyclase
VAEAEGKSRLGGLGKLLTRQFVMLQGIAALSTVVFLLLQLYDPSVLREYIESRTLDLRLYAKNLVQKPERPDDIVIVTVDEKSIAELGRWPWPRSIIADLVRKVSAGEPRAIGIDILFSEPEPGKPENDTALGEAIADAGNVALATGFLVRKEGSIEEIVPREAEYLWDHAILKVKSTEGMDWQPWIVQPEGVLPPIETLTEGAHLGHVYTQQDRDGVLRWEILALHYEDDYYISMPLQVARMFLGVELEDLTLVGGSGVSIGERFIHTDLSLRVLLNYLGPEGTFQYVSAADVLAGRVDPSVLFRGKAVFIGTSAVATYDQKVTPLSANMPGVEKNATVVDNILRQRFIKRSPGVIEMVVTVLTAFVLAGLLHRLGALRGALLSMLLVSLYVVVAFYVFINHGLWLNLVYPAGNMLVIIIGQGLGKYFFEERRASQMRAMFSSYVSPRVVEALIANPELARLGGQKKEVTVLFSDIAGFTSLSEKLQPEEVVSLLNEYFKVMTDIIFRWEGTFDKIVGDEIMAFWGAPIDQPDHPELAVRCALNMFKELDKLHLKWISENRPVLNIGIGLNTGVVLVGNIGAEDKKMDYTIIGDHVNTGARVEAETRKFQARILMTEYTADRIRPLIDDGRIGHVELKYRGGTKVKGKEKELPIYELIDHKDEEDEDHHH